MATDEVLSTDYVLSVNRGERVIRKKRNNNGYIRYCSYNTLKWLVSWIDVAIYRDVERYAWGGLEKEGIIWRDVRLSCMCVVVISYRVDYYRLSFLIFLVRYLVIVVIIYKRSRSIGWTRWRLEVNIGEMHDVELLHVLEPALETLFLEENRRVLFGLIAALLVLLDTWLDSLSEWVILFPL